MNCNCETSHPSREQSHATVSTDHRMPGFVVVPAAPPPLMPTLTTRHMQAATVLFNRDATLRAWLRCGFQQRLVLAAICPLMPVSIRLLGPLLHQHLNIPLRNIQKRTPKRTGRNIQPDMLANICRRLANTSSGQDGMKSGRPTAGSGKE